MAANSSLVLTSLDFDTLKQNFKNYLSSQSVFRDYNFDSSSMSVLLDVMSYNTYLNSFYLNMVTSEMFLDSAQKYDSVVSHAKELNYTPRSYKSSDASVDLVLNTTGVTSPFIIPKGTMFTGVNSNGNFSFTTNNDYSYIPVNNVITAANLNIFEGIFINDSYVVDYTQPRQRFLLSNQKIDMDSLSITVIENGSNTNFEKASTLYGLNNSSNVFFVQASQNNQYEVVFGDGIFGRIPVNLSIIVANYRVSSGDSADGISSFSLSRDLGAINGGVAVVNNISTSSNSSGGAIAETTEEIRFNAPRFYQTQGRCITTNDYKTTILQNFPDVEAVNVYGSDGITNSVEFGTVFIVPSSFSGSILSDSRKQDIKTYINKLSPIGIATKIIDPDYLFITINSIIHCNFDKTSSTAATINNLAIQTTKTFNTDNLQQFDTSFRASRYEQAINDSDIGILSNETTTTIYKTFTPPDTLPHTILCDLNNKVIKGSIISSTFTSNNKTYKLTDKITGTRPSGILYLVEETSSGMSPSYIKIGTVDYTLGIIVVNAVMYNNIGAGIKIYATPVNQDIYCKNNTIVEIDTISGLTFTTVNN